MDLVLDSLIDAFSDSIAMVPLLLVIYFLIEWAEYRFGNRIGHAVEKAGKAGPLIGAAAGIIPQCGISVVASALYVQRLATVGTLLAVFLATSDEAIPVILSQPDKIGTLLPLLLTKFVVALIAGYAIDLIMRRHNCSTLAHIDAVENSHDEAGHDHSKVLDEKACCGHHPTSEHDFDEKVTRHNFPRELFIHPIVHTLKVFAFIFVISFLLALLFAVVGQDTLAALLAGHPYLQILLSTLVGLIPNCAASVAVTEFYLSGVISFGSCVAGLCAGGGLGLLVLFREGDKKEALRITGLLVVISIAAGLLAGLIFP